MTSILRFMTSSVRPRMAGPEERTEERGRIQPSDRHADPDFSPRTSQPAPPGLPSSLTRTAFRLDRGIRKPLLCPMCGPRLRPTWR
jgi:hypothetical protein